MSHKSILPSPIVTVIRKINFFFFFGDSDPPELSFEDRVRLLKSLESWYFEPLRMPEHEVLACVLFLFQVLFRIEGMREAIKVDMRTSLHQTHSW